MKYKIKMVTKCVMIYYLLVFQVHLVVALQDNGHELECQTVSVELKNGASVAQGRKTGTYQRKEVFGKLSYWTSKNYAIWYNSKAKAWAIGNLASLGTNSQGILGIKGEFRWPFDKKYRWMYYKSGSGWMKTGRNDITVKCKDGENNNCRVIEEGTEKIVHCVFPFKIGGKMFYNCTHDFDPDGKFWCSTKTNSSSSEHVPGNDFWGFCEEKLCPAFCADTIKTSEEQMNQEMMDAVNQDKMEIISCLVFKGADVNGKDVIGDTPLIFASANGNLEIVKYLVAKGANVNVQDQYDDTPLLWATYYGYFDVVRFLVENGSNVTIKNKYGKSALQYAEQKGFVTLADYLRPIQNGPK